MPRLTAYSVRAALVYLLAGFTMGALILANKGIPFMPWSWYLLPSHIEFLVFGFLVQMVLGIGFWILPRYPGGSRGNELVAVAAVALLNLGIVLVAFESWVGWKALTFAGHSLEAVAAALFAANGWNRIRRFGRP